MSRKYKRTLSQIGEFGLIERIARLAGHQKGVIKGIGDDAAVLAYDRKKYLLLTTDMLVEGRHFTKKMGAKAIGRKSLACSISDIAAMGGIPTYAVVSLGVPGHLNISFIDDLYRGMAALANQFKIAIVGGDTVSCARITINVALLGEVDKKDLTLRCGAKIGDKIFVTGPLGRSLKTKKHLNFMPRLKESQCLVKSLKPTAMIDISDGLAGDLGHILESSRAGAFLYEQLIPCTRGASLKEALYDGEDFELVFTLPPKKAQALIDCRKNKPRFYYIGDVTGKRNQLVLIDAQGNKKIIPQKGFTHF